jgi:DNA-binding beta-propeller fold protein YncE
MSVGLFRVRRPTFAVLAVALICAAAPGVARAERTVLVSNIDDANVAAFSGRSDGTLAVFPGSPFPTSQDGPTGVTFSPDARFAYVANVNDDSVSRFRVNENGNLTPLGTVPTGANQPTGLALTPDGSRLLVANRDSSGNAPRVSVFDVDPDIGALDPAPTSPADPGNFDPRGIAISPDGRLAYISGRQGPMGGPPGSANSAVAVVEINADGSLTPIPGSPFVNAALLGGFGIALAPDGERLFLAHASNNVIEVFDVNQNTGAPSPVANSPFAAGANAPIVLEPTPDGRRLYVVESVGQSVQGFNVNAANGMLSGIAGTPEAIGGQPDGIAVTPSGTHLYASRNDDPGVVFGFSLTATGDLSAVSGSPYPTGGGFPNFFSAAVSPTQTPNPSFALSGGEEVGDPTAFDARATRVRGGLAAGFDWDFGDGTSLANGGPTPTHVYEDSAPHRVELTVTNDCAPDAVFNGGVVTVGSTTYCNGPRRASAIRIIDTSLALDATARKRQRVGKLKAKLSCPDEPCEVEIGGRTVAKSRGGAKKGATAAKSRKRFKLKPKSLSLEAGETRKVRLKYRGNKRAVKRARRLLQSGSFRRGSRAKIKVTATDAAGNQASEALKVKRLRP